MAIMASWHPKEYQKQRTKSADHATFLSLTAEGGNVKTGAYGREVTLELTSPVRRIPVKFGDNGPPSYGRSISETGSTYYLSSQSHPSHIRQRSADSAGEHYRWPDPLHDSTQSLLTSSHSSIQSPHGTGVFSPLSLSTMKLDEIGFDRAAFGQELKMIINNPSLQNYLYLRQLLIRLLIDPKLAGLRARIVSESATSLELEELFQLIDKVSSWVLPKKAADAQREMKAIEQTIREDIEKSFPTYNILNPVKEYDWDGGAKSAKDILSFDQEFLQKEVRRLGVMLEPLVSDNGLIPGEINDPAGYYRPKPAVPLPAQKHQEHDESFYIPVNFAFVLDGKSVKLPLPHFTALSQRKFIRLFQAKQSVVSSEEYWKKLSRGDQQKVGGEIINDDFSMCSDTTRFDCKYVMAHGNQLPPAPLFSSREYRTAYEKKYSCADNDLATGQMFVEVLQYIGGFSPAELQFVAGIFSQGAVNEMLTYCCTYYFPDRNVAFCTPTVSEELHRDPAKLARMEVIDWGSGCLELVCEFQYDRYSISPQDRTKFRADTKATVKVLAQSTGEKISLAKISMSIEVDRRHSMKEKLSMIMTKGEALRVNKESAEKFKEDYSPEVANSQKYVERAYSAQYEVLAKKLVEQKCEVAELIASEGEQTVLIQLLAKNYSSTNEKVKAVKAQLQECHSIIKPQLGKTRPLPSWMLELKPEEDSPGESRLEQNQCRLIYTETYGWVATNFSASETQASEAHTPRMKHAISKDKLFESKVRSHGDTSSVQVIKPKPCKGARYSRLIADHQKKMHTLGLKPGVLSKLLEHFQLPSDTKEEMLMVKIQKCLGHNMNHPDWDNELVDLLDRAGLVEKEKRSATKYITQYYQTVPTFASQRAGSLPSLLDTEVGPDKGGGKHRRQLSEQLWVYPSQSSMAGRASHPDLFGHETILGPVLELSTFRVGHPKLTAVEKHWVEEYVEKFKTDVVFEPSGSELWENSLTDKKQELEGALLEAGIQDQDKIYKIVSAFNEEVRLIKGTLV